MMTIFKTYAKTTALKKIDKGFSKQLARLATLISSGKRNEEETRRWCIDVLRDALGYKDEDIETESKVLGQRVDIALKEAGRVFMVIECKAATVNLNKSAINQAATYAIGLGADWAVVTNGQRWRLFHVSPTQGVEPDILEIFDISILDEDGISEDDLNCLYLLRADAINSGETKQLFHKSNSTSIKRIRDAFLSPQVVLFVCRKLEDRYGKNMGVAVSITPDMIYPIMDEIFAKALNENN